MAGRAVKIVHADHRLKHAHNVATVDDRQSEMHRKRPFLKQKPILYFDENFPDEVIAHFSSTYWRKQVKVVSAAGQGYIGRSDTFHYDYCMNNGYTLVTLDLDFNNDRLFPFRQGMMAGIIMLRASSSAPRRIVDLLSRVLDFIVKMPLPKAFLAETKFVAALNGVVMRGRNVRTKEIKALHIKAGVTRVRDVRAFFDY